MHSFIGKFLEFNEFNNETSILGMLVFCWSDFDPLDVVFACVQKLSSVTGA